jgi:hypothetical protein
MFVHLTVPMFVPVVQIGFPVCMGVFVEDQGLHSHRHSVGGHPNASQINEVKAPKGNAIDHQDLTLNALIFLKNVAQVVRNVAIGDDEKGSFLMQGARNG